MQIRTLFFVQIIVFFAGCVEPYHPKLNDYIEIPVVDGIITNEAGPYIVTLSKSSTVYNPEFDPIVGAEVTISDDLNYEEVLTEIEPGVYSTDPDGIRGKVGRKYQVTIKKDGKTYQSAFEELQEPVEIDSVYSKVEYKENREGLQFYLNTGNISDNHKQFLYTMVETYKYEADDYPIDYIYVKADSIIIPAYDYIKLIKVCWKTDKVTQIFTGAANKFSDSKIENFPLHYVNTESKKLFIKYSLLVRQYSISNDAYKYWTEIKEQNEKSGSLYVKQPFQLIGNLTDINNPASIILGYFTVAGVSQKRYFVNKPTLKFYFDECKASHQTYLAWLEQEEPPYPAYIKLVVGGLGKASLNCFDCRSKGGTTNKPDFWED